jgi:hypothetical protein
MATESSGSINRLSNHEKLAMTRLAAIAKHLAKDHRKKLLALKSDSKKLGRPDFIWEELLRTMSVMGNSRGHKGLMENRENHSSVSYDNLLKWSPRRRRMVLKATLRRANVSYAPKKASWLDSNFNLIKKGGGPRTFTKRLLSQPDKEEIIRFLRGFEGIGEQNARNIMMNIYHPYFRDSIKVDLRIKKISKRLGLHDGTESQEKFYRRAALIAGLNGWELDRLLYNFTDEFLCRLDY